MDWTSFVESPKSGASHSRVLCLGCFLVLTQLLQPLNLLQLLIVPNDPKCGTAVAAMGGVPSKTNADEEDEYHDEVHDSKARWQVFSGEKKDVNKNDLSILGNSMWDLIWCLTVCNYQICMFWNVMFKFTSAEMIYHYDSLCCSSSRAMTSLNQDLSTICLNKSRKKTNKGKRAQRFINFFLSKTYELRMMSTFVRSLRQSIQKTRNLSLYESGLGIHTPGLSLWLPWREGKIRFWDGRWV